MTQHILTDTVHYWELPITLLCAVTFVVALVVRRDKRIAFVLLAAIFESAKYLFMASGAMPTANRQFAALAYTSATYMALCTWLCMLLYGVSLLLPNKKVEAHSQV